MLIVDIEELGRIERFQATLDGRVLCRSRQPLLASARVLLAEGVAPKTVIGMRGLHAPPGRDVDHHDRHPRRMR
jgi:hypothetical protein